MQLKIVAFRMIQDRRIITFDTLINFPGQQITEAMAAEQLAEVEPQIPAGSEIEMDIIN